MKNYKLFISSLILIFVSYISFSQIQGSITDDILNQIKQSYKEDAYTKSIINAVSNNNIKKLALNRKNVGKTDHYYKYKVKVKGITDQKKSGRCWMFTGLNVLRPKVIEKFNLEEFEFSTNYLYFWDQLEKANLFLEAIIATRDKNMDDRIVEWLFKHAISDGGVWNLLTGLIEKYGLVPKKVMPETNSSENTSLMQRLIRRKLRENGMILRRMAEKGDDYQKLEQKKIVMLSEIYRMLIINLGEPPSEFTWRFKDKDGKISEPKTYTPISFYKEIFNINFDDYILFMDNPSRPYYKLYEIEYDRNIYEGYNWKYINIPAEEIKIFAKNSIIDNEAMYFSCDVGKQLNKEEGLLSNDNYDYESIFGIKFGMDKKDRILTYESGSTHGMALVGVDVDKDGNPVKWLLENTWGSTAGHNGYLTMTDKWFDEYMFRVVVHKKFVDKKTLEILKQKPIMAPPWDPMFLPDM